MGQDRAAGVKRISAFAGIGRPDSLDLLIDRQTGPPAREAEKAGVNDRDGLWLRSRGARGGPILPRWWRTLDKWVVGAVFLLFQASGFCGASGPPRRRWRNATGSSRSITSSGRSSSGAIEGLSVSSSMSMLSPTQVRRLRSDRFLAAYVPLAFLPLFGTDFGKGGERAGIRWGFGSLQPFENSSSRPIVVVAGLAHRPLDGTREARPARAIRWRCRLPHRGRVLALQARLRAGPARALSRGA